MDLLSQANWTRAMQCLYCREFDVDAIELLNKWDSFKKTYYYLGLELTAAGRAASNACPHFRTPIGSRFMKPLKITTVRPELIKGSHSGPSEPPTLNDIQPSNFLRFIFLFFQLWIFGFFDEEVKTEIAPVVRRRKKKRRRSPSPFVPRTKRRRSPIDVCSAT